MPSQLFPLIQGGRRPGPKYLTLIRKFPLRPIRSEEQNEMALSVLAGLAERRERQPLEAQELDYIAVLAKLVEEYEDAHYPRGPVSGTEMLAHLIEARGINIMKLRLGRRNVGAGGT